MAPFRAAWTAPLALAVLAVALVPASLDPAQLPCTRDLLDFFLPMKAQLVRAASRPEIPWWDPWTLGGTPFVASLQSGAFYPPNVVFLLVPLPRALSLFIVLHLALAGTGAWLLARELGRGAAASFLAGIAFEAGGFTMSLVDLDNQLCTIAWMPWTCLAAVRALRGDGRVLRGALAGWIAASSLALLAGEPQLAVEGGALSLALAWAAGRRPGAPGGRLRGLRRVGLAGATVAATVALCCAVQLVPFVELVLLSDRVSEDFASGGRHALDVARVLAFVEPPTSADPAPAGSYVRSIHLGWIVALLAITGSLRRDLVTRVLLAASALSLLLALGVVSEATPFLRYPVKHLAIVALVAPLLAASGLDRLVELARSRGRAGAIAGAAVALASIELIAAHRGMVESAPFEQLMAPTAVHSLLAADTSPDGPRVHAPPITQERLRARAARVLAGDAFGAQRERVELLEGGLPAWFGIHATWGGAALMTREQAELLQRADGPLDAGLASALRAGFLLDDARRRLPLREVPVDGGAARLYVLDDMPSTPPRSWDGSSRCIGAAGLPPPSTYPGWREGPPGTWTFRPRGLPLLAAASLLGWTAVIALLVLGRRDRLRPAWPSRGSVPPTPDFTRGGPAE